MTTLGTMGQRSIVVPIPNATMNNMTIDVLKVIHDYLTNLVAHDYGVAPSDVTIDISRRDVERVPLDGMKDIPLVKVADVFPCPDPTDARMYLFRYRFDIIPLVDTAHTPETADAAR